MAETCVARNSEYDLDEWKIKENKTVGGHTTHSEWMTNLTTKGKMNVRKSKTPSFKKCIKFRKRNTEL